MSRPHSTDLSLLMRCRSELAGDIRAALKDASASDDEEHLHVELRSTRTGDTSLRVADRWIHSSVDPRREADRIAAGLVAEARKTDKTGAGVVIIGLGLGHHLEALAEARRSSRLSGAVVAVCLSPAILYAALAHRNTEWWCDYGPDRLVPAWLPGTLAPVLRDLGIDDPLCVELAGLAAVQAERFERIRDEVRRYRQRRRVNRNTLRRFGRLWVRNTLHTIRRWGVFPDIDRLAGIAAGVPAIVCGAGPTLDETLPHLPDIARRAVVIAVDTAVAALKRVGLEADIAIIADPQYWNTRHLDSVGDTATVLVAEPATYPRTLRLWTGPILVSASLFPLGSFFDTLVGRSLKLGAGGSVATSAWDLARVLGSKNIALAGVDLGFPGYQTHCRDSFFEVRLQRIAERLEPAEHGLWKYLHGAGATLVPSAAGKTVVSDKRMEVYRGWFEEQALRYPETRTVLLSSESSAIDGVPYTSPLEWLADASATGSAIEEARRTLAGAAAGRPAEADRLVERLMESLGEIRVIAADGITTCDDASRTLLDAGVRDGAAVRDGETVRRTLGALDEIDRRLSSLAHRELAGFLAAEALEEATTHVPNTPLESISQARAIYTALDAAAEYHRALLVRYRA
ncbi:MAG: DUF115 domain-containing protein [Spirochaetales bacterium]|nr:DUF115 domain-containing protein [Spirochaetales bacterium]